MDVGTRLAALGTAEVSKDVLAKILGPTAEYIGEGVRDWTERRVENVQRSLAVARLRLGDEIERPGIVPPRVLKAVLEEAQFADDELTASYLGGVLASSRSEIGRDDRAAVLAQLVGSLSSYALRTHYLMYSAARRHEAGADPDRWRGSRDEDNRFFIEVVEYFRGMAFDRAEVEQYTAIFADTMLSLDRHDLVGKGWASGPPERLRSTVLNLDYPAPGIVYSLTQFGIALYCGAHGVRSDPFTAFCDAALDLSMVPEPPSVNAVRVSAFPPYVAETAAAPEADVQGPAS